MRIQILGSAAAEAIPALWCECECCAYARKHGGKDVRRRCSYRIDGDTLVDFGPDANWQSVEFGIDLTKINRILFTHAHEDHLNPVELVWRMRGYSKVTRAINVYGPPAVFDRLRSFDFLTMPHLQFDQIGINPTELKSGVPVADGDLTIIPVEASHIPGQLCLNYIISRGGKSVLIANDTGWWRESSWELVKNYKLDAAIIECTFALFEGCLDMIQGHLGAQAAVRFRDKLREIGALSENAQVAVNHYSHNGNPLQHKLEEYYKNTGIAVGYDGMVIEL